MKTARRTGRRCPHHRLRIGRRTRPGAVHGSPADGAALSGTGRQPRWLTSAGPALVHRGRHARIWGFFRLRGVGRALFRGCAEQTPSVKRRSPLRACVSGPRGLPQRETSPSPLEKDTAMARVTVEDCIDKVENRFDLVLLASHRARLISSGAPITIDRDNDKNPVVALREIADERFAPEDMREDLIHSLQKHVEVDEPEPEAVPAMTPSCGEEPRRPRGQPRHPVRPHDRGRPAARPRRPGAPGRDGRRGRVSLRGAAARRRPALPPRRARPILAA